MTNHTEHTKDAIVLGWEAPKEKPQAMGFAAPDTASAEQEARRPIAFDGEGHLMTIAPTGKGKGRAAIIPTLLTYDGPVIVVDPKGENYFVTARRRRDMGHKVILLDPFSVTGDEAAASALNPLQSFDASAPEAVQDAAALSEMIAGYQRSTSDPFWDDRAKQLITALILHVATSRPPVLKNLHEVLYLLNQSREDMAFTVKEMAHSKNDDVKAMSAILGVAEPKVSASIVSTAQSKVEFLRGSGLNWSMSFNSLDLDAVTRGDPLSIYLVLPPDKLRSHGRVLRLWLGVLMQAVMKRRHKVDKRTLFIIDEAAQLGHMETLLTAMTLLRGYGLQTWTFWQDLSQLQSTYPNDWETMFNNAAVHQVFGATNMRMADKVAGIYGGISARRFFNMPKNNQLLTLPEGEAKEAQLADYLEDDMFKGLFDPNPYYQPAEQTKPSDRREPESETVQALPRRSVDFDDIVGDAR